ncbi:unnamed protein product (macronuclear) [Paramecium tetraurelia]|uniref:Non-specific serine/threonine protein kinase n=1 Tax=Paramecium tetraurelia TaxID=5888 RepID=A0BZJ6_PARTE|nr:uncharacterized protein GSPATT00033816001 [Paramecium tetraurelia]CAK63963.1 unnamed protein product [Paramecium tetraurelia]|eukprot:XP_001431361.1 hypothetical protein (macronuclear) [Paramecium tetraurelia strain d4-2]
MSQIDPAYFERLKDQLNNLNSNNESFTERNIFEIRERLGRISEEVHQERNRDSNHVFNLYNCLQQVLQNNQKTFVDSCLNFIVYVLQHVEPQTTRNTKFLIRAAILDLLQKKILLQHMTFQVVEQMTIVLEKDNENNAAVAIRIINDLLKSNQQQSHQYQRSNTLFSDQLLLKLYSIFEQRIEFLVKFNNELKKSQYKKLLGDNQNNPFWDQNYVLQSDIEDKREKDIRLNIFSLSFVTNIPTFFIYTIFVLDSIVKEETKTQMREILKRALKTMNQVINETNFQDLLQKVPRNIVQELFNAYSKFLQLLALTIKRDDNQMQPQSRIIKDISDTIKLDSVVAIIIKTLKHCPVDIMHLRIDISNRLKQSIIQKRDTIQQNDMTEKINEINANVAELIDEETIVGKNLKIPPYQKTSIYQNWLDIVKHVVQSYLPKCEQQNQQPTNLERMQSDFINNQTYMEKIFNTIFKVLFDSSLQISIHEKALDLIKVFLDLFKQQNNYFIDRNLLQYYIDQPQQQQQQNDSIFKEVTTHSPKYKLLDRLFQMIGMKLAQIRKQIQQIKEMLNRTQKWGIIKKTTSQTNVSSMPCNNEPLSERYISQLEQYIKENEIDIDQNLITLQDQAATQVYTYDDEEEYQVNSISINSYSQFIEYAKEVKSKIFDQLNDILQKLLNFVALTNKEIVAKYKNRQNGQNSQRLAPLIQATNESRPYLSNLQCHYMSKIMKNGLIIFDELHDHQRNHFEILDYKKKTIPQFMQFFIQFQDPINFKNIFEPNSKLLLKISVNLIKTCPETHCLPLLLQDHLQILNHPDNQSQPKLSVKYYIEFLLNLYLRELQTTPELPSRFGYCRGGQLIQMSNQKGQNVSQKDQDEYISLIQKLLRIPIRLFPRVKCQQNEEPIVKPLLKQLILFFVKKSHETYYPIDFLGLLLSLVKRIQNNDQGEGLSKYFQQLCDKYDRNDRQQMLQRQSYEIYHKLNLSGVNIVLNMFELFQTGIVEIQDIVAEVIANFPLQKTMQINLAKQYPVFAQCLFRALHNISTIENQVIQKTLMLLENIVTNLSMEEMREFFGDLLQPFIEKLLTFPSEYKMADIYSKQVNLFLDPSFKSLKILSKLGALVRKSEWPIEIKRTHTDNPFVRNQYLEVQIEGLQTNLKINLSETVRCAVEILQNFLEQQLATYLFKQSSIQHSYSIVKMVLLGYYQMPIQFDHDLYNYQIPEGMALDMRLQSRSCEQDLLMYQDEELISAVTKVFIGLSNFHNIIQTLTTATFHKLKEDVENVVTTLSEMFFIQLADDHCEQIQQLKQTKPDLNSLYAMTEDIVAKYLREKPQSIKWLSHLFKGLNKRYMLTAEENMNFKDFYIQQHEFIWIKLLMGNCLKKYKRILNNHFKKNNENMAWAYNVYYTVVIRLFEEFVYEKFGKQTQLQKEDDRRRKIQIVQSYGGTMIPSEGLNCRSISIELLTEIQNLRPKFKDYYTSNQILGLPYIPDQRIVECSFILLRQLSETIRVVSQQLTKHLLFQTLNQLIENLNVDHSKYAHSHQSILILSNKLREFVKVVAENCLTFKKSLLQICTELFDHIITNYYKGNAGPLFYMNIGDGMNPRFDEQIKPIPLDEFTGANQSQLYWVNIDYSEIPTSPYTQNTVLRELVLIIKQLCEEQKMSDITAQRYANGFRILSYLLQKQGRLESVQYHLFKVVQFENDPSLIPCFEDYVQQSFKIIQQNEETYYKQSKLILTNEEYHQQQNALINVSHGLDDLEFKINIEDIDFEIKWQSYMVVAVYGFLKSMATVNYIYLIQKHLQRNIDKNQTVKPVILAMKFKIVEILYEGLLRVESSIRQAGYRYLQELLQQEGISNDKTLFENDERLKKVMKPLLTCVQSDIFHYIPSFLKSLKLILKIFSKVFHKALSDKLQAHLTRIVQDNYQQQQPITQNVQYCTTIEWIYQQNQSPRIIKLLDGYNIWTHLTSQLTNPSIGANNINIVQKIITDTNNLRRNYVFKVSQMQLNQSIDKPLVKFLNTLAANYFDVFQSSYNLGQIQQFQKQLEGVSQLLANQTPIKGLWENLRERLQYIKTVRQVISEPTAFPLREKLCREKSQLALKMERFNKIIEDLSSSLEKGLMNVQTVLPPELQQSFHQSYIQKLINVISEIKIEIVQFGFQLCKRNPSCLKKNNHFLDNCILNNIKDLLEKQKQNNQNRKVQQSQLQQAYNQLILSNQQINSLLNRHCSMLKQFISQNEDSKLAISGMLRLILYSTQDKVKKWVMNVAMNKSISLRKRIIEIWMDNFKFSEDDQLNQVQMITGYHVIYPILFHSNQRNDLSQISQLSLFQRMKEINDDFFKYYGKILSDIEHHCPMNFTYKLHNNNLTAKLSDVNHYYKSSVIDMLQISSYLLCFQEQQLPSDLKMSFLQFGYDMINKSDKLVAFHANLYFSKFLKKIGLIQNDPISVNKRYLKIYNKALKQLDESGQSEQELYSLCKKIFSVVLPWLDQVEVQDQKDWIQATQQQLKQESSNLDFESAQKVSRFWSMFIKNHKIFHKHHESFTIHIINSMQQIGFFNQNQSPQAPIIINSYQNYRRIALDMAFLQVEWKTKLIKNDLLHNNTKKFRDSFYQSEAQNHDESLSSEIYQSFFIKQSLKAHNTEDAELQKRALYLLKKILIIAPLTNYKMNMETVKKNIVNLMNSIVEPQQGNQNLRMLQQQPTAYFRYFLIVLHILTIIAEFQPSTKISQLYQPCFDIIFQMNLLPDQLQYQLPPRPNAGRIPPTQPRQPPPQTRIQYSQPPADRGQQHQNALTQDHAQLVFLIFNIFRKLLKNAKENQNEESDRFQNSLSNWVKEAVQQHLQIKKNSQQQMNQFMGPRLPAQALKVNILSIFLLKLFFNHDITYVRPLMPSLKRIAELLIDYLKQKDKGDQYLDNMRRYTIPKKQFNIRENEQWENDSQKQYTHTDLSSYISDFGLMTDDFPFGVRKSEELLYFPEDFPENQKIKFHLYRSALQKTLKMMAYNFDEIKDQKEQIEYLQILIWIIESVPDYELKLECIAILRMLFINGISNVEGYLQAISVYLSPVRSFQMRSELKKMEENLQFKPSKMSCELQFGFFFDLNKFQSMFDKKIDQRSSDSYDNQHGKIQDLKVFKLYFIFLCELLLVYPFKKQQGSINSGFYLLKNIYDKGNGSLREFRRILQIISKLSTCLDYLQFFYKMILDIYGYTYDRFLQFVLGDPNNKQQEQPLQTEGEEIMLMAVKFMMLGRGHLLSPKLFQPTQPNKLVVKVVPKDEDSMMREQVLNKYLAIYYRKKYWQKLYNSSIKLFTSEYLPSIVIYNLSYIPLQDQPQQPLRECIIPSAAIELLGTAANVSSRLLKPIFNQVIVNDIKTITQITDYVSQQSISNGTLQTISNFLVQQILSQITNIYDIMDNQQTQLNFNNLIMCLKQKNLLPSAQYLLEYIYQYLNEEDSSYYSQLNEDILVQLQGVYQEQWNKQCLLGCKALTATQPWVKQLVLLNQLREPAQSYQLILNNQESVDQFWLQLEQETNEAQGIQKEYDQQIIHQLFTESLQQLNQWNTLKQVDLSRVQAVQNRIIMGFRERQKDTTEQGWKELNQLSDVKQNIQQNDHFCYNQAYFKLLDFVRDEASSNQHGRGGGNHVLQSIEQNLKYAQIINCYNFIKTLPKLTQSYDQMMASPLLWGSKFLNFVSQFQLYTELEESLRQYAPTQPAFPGQAQPSYEQQWDLISNSYQSSLLCKKYFFERQPTIIDQQEFTFDLISQRMVQLQMCLQRFNGQLSQLLSSQQLPANTSIDQKSYQLAVLDYKTLLYPMRYYQQNGIFELFDEQSILKEIPKTLQGYAEKIYQLEKIKFKTIKFQDVDNNQQNLTEMLNFFSSLQSGNYSAEEFKNYMISKIRRYKMINQFYKLLRLDQSTESNNGMQIEEQKLEVMVSQTNEFFIQNQVNYLKFWKEAHKVYQLAHKRYSNNIKFAHHYIQITPLSMQYKPQKFPITGMYMFHILNITNQTDSIVTDAFSQIVALIPLHLLQRFFTQLVSTYLQTPCDQTRKDCLDAITKLCTFNPLNSFQLLQYLKSLGQCTDERSQQLINSIPKLSKLNHKIASIYSLRYLYNSVFDQLVWDNVEEIVYQCGKILDSKQFEINSSNINDRCQQILNIIQKYPQIKEMIKQYWQFGDLNKQLKSDQLKTIQSIYLASIKCIYINLFGVNMSLEEDFPLQLSNSINSFMAKQIQIDQLYSINDEFQMNPLPMLGLDGQIKRTQAYETIQITNVFPTIHIIFLRRKRFIRQIALLGNDEKKYLFLLKTKKIESKKPVQSILEEHISTQFVKMTNMLNQNYKETKIRNVKHIVSDKYLLEHDKLNYQLEPYQEETYNLSNILDTILQIHYHANPKGDSSIKIPYYNTQVDYLQKNDLTNLILRFSKTVDTFVQIRKIIVVNIAVQYALSFTMASSQSPKQLENLQINLSNGNFYQKKYLFKVNNQRLTLYDPFAIRYSRNIEHLVGEINLNAYLIPTFTATIIGILNIDLHEYLNVVFWQLGCKDSLEPFIKKLKDIVYEDGIIDSKCERLIAISKTLFSGQEKLKLWAKRWF